MCMIALSYVQHAIFFLTMIRHFSSGRKVCADFTHTVIGAGVVGLAVAAELAKRPDNKVLIIEKNGQYGQETSSRNSEVVHAGLYYPQDSLKTKLCIRGKELLYSLGEQNVPTVKCGKWVVAQNENQRAYLEGLHSKAQLLGVPTKFVSLSRAKILEPAVRVGANGAILNSPTTGITSAHHLMAFLAMQLDNAGGEMALGTEVVGMRYDKHNEEYELETQAEGEKVGITSNCVVNSAGLYAPKVAKLAGGQWQTYFAKGNYFSFTGKNPGISRLVYPCPTPGVASLGTHLTIDLGGQIRFGPDLEWVDHVNYHVTATEERIAMATKEVAQYFPGVMEGELHGSYCGIRPKIVGPGGGFQDFVVREESAAGFPRWVNLVGIESPGLTAALAVGEMVGGMI